MVEQLKRALEMWRSSGGSDVVMELEGIPDE